MRFNYRLTVKAVDYRLLINAANLLHLFLTIQTALPTTKKRALCIQLLSSQPSSYLVTKTGLTHFSLRGFSDLPEHIGESFHKALRLYAGLE